MSSYFTFGQFDNFLFDSFKLVCLVTNRANHPFLYKNRSKPTWQYRNIIFNSSMTTTKDHARANRILQSILRTWLGPSTVPIQIVPQFNRNMWHTTIWEPIKKDIIINIWWTYSQIVQLIHQFCSVGHHRNLMRILSSYFTLTSLSTLHSLYINQ